jgi:hypothetical protein
MAGTLKSVRFTLAWQTYRVGDVITPNGTLRDWLVGNGYAQVVQDLVQDDGRPATLTRRAVAKLVGAKSAAAPN